MNIDEVQIVGGPLVLAMPDEVDSLESRLWIKFPDGYREYVTRLGEGVLGGSLVRIYPPWRVEKELSKWRRRIAKYWFWDEGREVLPKDRAVECVIVGDTLNGDELVFHPGRHDRLFVLPSDGERVFMAGSDLPSAVEWMCGSGELVEPFSERRFEPFDSRTQEGDRGASPGQASDPEGESLDEIIELGRRWAERHAARKACQKELRQHTGQGKSGKLVEEAIILEGNFPCAPGYAIKYSIVDKPSGLEVGVFRGSITGDSSGSAYEPNQGNLAKLRGQSGS